MNTPSKKLPLVEEVCGNFEPFTPLGDYIAPPLDLEGLPHWVKCYVESLASATETPPELAFALVMAALSLSCARVVEIEPKQGYTEPLAMWWVVALPPASRKSSVQAAVTKPFNEWMTELAKELEPEIKRLSTEREVIEKRIAKLKKQAADTDDTGERQVLLADVERLEVELPEVPRVLQLWVSDSTPESLGQLLHENGELIAFFSSEGGVFDMLAGRYSNGIPNLDLILKSHSGDSDLISRISRLPIHLIKPLIVFGLAVQPEVLEGLAWQKGFAGRGLLARFFYLMPPSNIGYRSLNAMPMSEQIEVEYSRNIRAMLDWLPNADADGKLTPYQLRLDQDATADYKEFESHIERQLRNDGMLAGQTAWGGKFVGGCLRLAGVIHCAKYVEGTPWNYPVDKQTLETAFDIGSVVMQHSLNSLEHMGTDSTVAGARHVWEWIKRQRKTSLKRNDVLQGVKGKFPTLARLRPLLDCLQERGYIDIVTPDNQGAGRPSTFIYVRPELVEV